MTKSKLKQVFTETVVLMLIFATLGVMLGFSLIIGSYVAAEALL